jgi:hypothetical protein
MLSFAVGLGFGWGVLQLLNALIGEKIGRGWPSFWYAMLSGGLFSLVI